MNRKEQNTRLREAAREAGDPPEMLWEIVLLNRGLAWKFARRYGDGSEDDYHIALEGLYQAVAKWEPERGGSLGKLAGWYTRNHLHRREGHHGIRIPPSTLSVVHWAIQKEKELWRQGVYPALSVLCPEHLDQETFAVLMANCRAYSYGQKTLFHVPQPEDNILSSIENWVEDKSRSPEDEALYHLACEKLIDLIEKTLTPREWLALSFRYGLYGEEEHSLGGTAQELAPKWHAPLSRERIRQILNRVLRDLKERIESGKPALRQTL